VAFLLQVFEEKQMQIVKNVTEIYQPPEPPRKEDGSQFEFEMLADGGNSRVYADTPEELLGYLIPGYEALDGVEHLTSRILFANTAAVALQAYAVSEADVELPEEERRTLEAPRDVPPQVAVWESEVPLVLVTTYYQPQGDLPRPTGRALGIGEEGGNLIWLDPIGETELIFSLAQAGWVGLNVRNGTAPAPDL